VLIPEITTGDHSEGADGRDRTRLRAAQGVLAITIANDFAIEATGQIQAAGERLARVVCADREMLEDRDVDEIADALWEAQVGRIGAAVDRVRARHPPVRHAVVTGLGEFLAAAAARRSDLHVIPLSDTFGAAARHAPAAAVALLFPS